MKRLTRILSLCICVVTIIIHTSTFVYAKDIERIDDVVYESGRIENYLSSMSSFFANEVYRGDSTERKIVDYQNGFVYDLKKKGVDAYAVNPSSYWDVKESLKTNLKELGIQEGDHCIIVISTDKSHEDKNMSSVKGAGASFSYSYGSKTYELRYLTVTASDNPSFSIQGRRAPLFSSNSNSYIRQMIQKTIIAGISAVNTNVGAIVDFCASVADALQNTTRAGTSLTAGASWTRVYTQVYSGYSNGWRNGSCTEYVSTSEHISGTYYNVYYNRTDSIPQNKKNQLFYAANYSNYSWRNRNAVIGYINSTLVTELTGSAKFYYNGQLKIQINENF